MKDRIVLAIALFAVSIPGFAGSADVQVPEPSSITLFAAAGAAVAVLARFIKKK